MAFKNSIGVRVPRPTKTLIENAAQAKGQSVSDFVRNSIIRDARMTLRSSATREEAEDE